jgi:hypothetical protein
MGTPVTQFCPLCRCSLCLQDAVRIHLIADHKRSAAQTDELIARFDIAKPIPEPEPEPHIYCECADLGSGQPLSRHSAAAPGTRVK